MGKDIYVNEAGEKINELFGLEGSCWFPFFLFSLSSIVALPYIGEKR